jgi:hypothetical protein
VFFGAVASISVDANNGDGTTPRALHVKSRGERSDNWIERSLGAKCSVSALPYFVTRLQGQFGGVMSSTLGKCGR